MDVTFGTAPAVARATAQKFTYSPWVSRCLSLTGPRTQSISFRNVIAAAIHPQLSLEDLTAAARESAAKAAEMTGPASARSWRALAVTCGYQDLLDDDAADALRFFDVARALDTEPWRAEEDRLYAQLMWEAGLIDRLENELPALRSMESEDSCFLRADLAAARHGVGSDPWCDALGTVTDRYGISRIRLGADGDSPFDRLATDESRQAVDGPLVSVIMSAFRPGPEIFTAVRSILDQTWQNLELLVVDDASGPEYREVLDKVAATDARVRVLVQPTNRGTYAIRNRALAEAHGEFITFQDSDDWSHPERVARQMQPLLDDATVHSSLSRSIRCSSTLTFQYRGQRTSRQNASSLLFRASVLERLGGFDTVRKGGDTEFIERLRHALPGSQADLEDQLAMVRLEPGSLSRSDFRPGWHHPSRTEYKESFVAWHRKIARGASPYVSGDPAERPFPAPRRFVRDTGTPMPTPEFDVVVVADWRGEARAALRQALALTERFSRVGFLHLEAQRRPAAFLLPMSRDLRTHVAAGRLTPVLLDDEARASLVLVSDPSALQFPPYQSSKWSVDEVGVIAEALPGSEYDLDDVRRGTKHLFGKEPHWLPAQESSRDKIAGITQPERVVDSIVPQIVSREDWRVNRNGFRSDRPVIGRIGPDSPEHWPSDPDILRAVYPTSPDIDVRMRGGRGAIRRVLGEIPPRWLVYLHRDDNVSVRQMLHQLDFFVYFPSDELTTLPELTVARAMAAGCVVVLPERFRVSYGDAAVYSAPNGVSDLVQTLRSDWSEYAAQSARGMIFAERAYPASRFVQYVDAYLTETLK